MCGRKVRRAAQAYTIVCRLQIKNAFAILYYINGEISMSIRKNNRGIFLQNIEKGRFRRIRFFRPPSETGICRGAAQKLRKKIKKFRRVKFHAAGHKILYQFFLSTTSVSTLGPDFKKTSLTSFPSLLTGKLNFIDFREYLLSPSGYIWISFIK